MDSLLQQPGIPDWNSEQDQPEHVALVQRIYEDFRLVTPAEGTKYLAHILNAGWKAAINNEPNVPDHSSQEVLRELILKSLEVLEFETKNSPSS